MAWYSSDDDPRSDRLQVEREESHDIFVQRAPDGRIFAYVAGPQFYVVDVTDVIEGSTTSDHLVGFNNYINADGTVTVEGRTTGSNGHYAEPTDDGAYTYVGDEISCGDPGIIHIFDTADLPEVGEDPRLLEEVGVLDWPTSNANQCSNRNADDASGDHPTGNNRNGKVTNFARTGHNFRIYGDIMTHGAYADGLYVWDISDPVNPTLLAQYKAAGGQECSDKRRETPEEKRLYRLCGSFWQAISDGDPDAVLAGEQYIYGSDRAGGLIVLRMRPRR
ncbi:hypothetical protein BH23ACT10_BH23ACT10_29490 [soil metagenome]